jgi:chlorobactene glucosyltransferase
MILLSLIILVPAIALLCVTLWNALAWERVRGVAATPPPWSMSILIPARDEEGNIGVCLDSALAQGVVVGEVLVYDDYSDDATARIVSEYAKRDARVRLVMRTPLPAGWCGKTFACARLANEARGRWLLFLDADARLERDAAARMVCEAESRGVTLLSCWPSIEMRGFWEQALMPLLNFVVFTLYPAPLASRRPLDPSLGLAHGACLVARRDVYKLAGGHTAVRDQLFEDVRLAQLWRERGQKSLCLDGRQIVRVRMYRSLTEIWQGFQKNFFPAFRHATSFWAFMALHVFVFLLPFGLAPLAFTRLGAWGFAAVAACVIASRAALAARFGHPWWSVLLHPLAEGFLVALGLASWLRCKTGRGVVWKGRRYGERAALMRLPEV